MTVSFHFFAFLFTVGQSSPFRVEMRQYNFGTILVLLFLLGNGEAWIASPVRSRLGTRSRSWLGWQLFSSRKESDQTPLSESTQPPSVGRVVSLAVRSVHPQDSRPNSRNYTTRKVAVSSANVTSAGLQGDCNHYRSVALANTTDRAVSLWTTDCLDWLRQVACSDVQPGDLGENVLIDGMDFDALAVGQSFRFLSADDCGSGSSQNDGELVAIQITEPVVPCANLCKLPYINQSDKTPKERIAACQDFLETLDQAPGLRGWYAKVLTEGTIHLNDTLERIT